MKTLAAVLAFGLALDLFVMFKSLGGREKQREGQE